MQARRTLIRSLPARGAGVALMIGSLLIRAAEKVGAGDGNRIVAAMIDYRFEALGGPGTEKDAKNHQPHMPGYGGETKAGGQFNVV